MKPSSDDIQKLIQSALLEDCPLNDVTSDSIIPDHHVSGFKILAKEDIICCGAEIARNTFQFLSSDFQFSTVAKDGDELKCGGVFLKGHGATKAVLKAERTALNIVQRLCGIATFTFKFKRLLKNNNIEILDTRKTTPNLRVFEKYAVAVGGGRNHRFGLSDMILLKENHLKIEAENGDGYIKRAVMKCKTKYPALKVEVEVRNIKEVLDAKESGADIIMLDNMNWENIIESIRLINKSSKIEISGGVSCSNIKDYIIDGVDFISIGALTHSVKSSDLSLLIE